MQTSPIRRTLPGTHLREIGRIITNWALFEWYMKNAAYRVLDLSPKEGRLALSEPRMTDFASRLRDLIKLRKLNVSFDWKPFNQTIETAQSHRDRLAHNVWLIHPTSPVPILQATKGSWQPDPKKPKIKRVLKPEGLPISLRTLRDLNKQIEGLIDGAVSLNELIWSAKQSSP